MTFFYGGQNILRPLLPYVFFCCIQVKTPNPHDLRPRYIQTVTIINELYATSPSSSSDRVDSGGPLRQPGMPTTGSFGPFSTDAERGCPRSCPRVYLSKVRVMDRIYLEVILGQVDPRTTLTMNRKGYRRRSAVSTSRAGGLEVGASRS